MKSTTESGRRSLISVKRKFQKSTSIGALIAISIFIATSASTPALAEQSPAPVASAPAANQGSDDASGSPRPPHRVDEEREGGFESAQLVLVGAAIVIALGLAYRAGRRRREK